jgi:sugar O-acyltransferase (sialic acid O-acetyltransferase NeuD family)
MQLMGAQKKRTVTIVGAGGHGKVVISTLLSCDYAVSHVLDDDPDKIGSSLLGVPVVGPVAKYLDNLQQAAIQAIGDNKTRCALARKHRDVDWITVVHRHAYVDPTVELGAGTVVFAGAVIQSEARIGRHAIVNTGATIDHDCRIGDYCHIAPGAHLAGDVSVGEGSLIGVGSLVNPGLNIGAWSTTGAGGVVITDLPGNVTAVGIPAKPRNGVAK